MSAFLGLICFILAALLGLAVTFWLQAKGELKSAEASLIRYQGIVDLEEHKAELQRKLEKAQQVLPKFQALADLEHHRMQLADAIATAQQQSREWEDYISEQEAQYAQLLSQTEAVEESLTMQSFGFYRPKYGFGDSARYSHQLEIIIGKQKDLVKAQQATHCPQDWQVDGSVAKGRKMINEQAKLMLRAFNGECDAAIAKVKFNNVHTLETRLMRSFEAINKLGKSKQLWITQDYLNYKLQELYLVHEHREKVEEEREEQRRIKEEMREEEKSLREFEKAKKEAENEAAAKAKALDKARQELAQAHGEKMNHLQAIVDALEVELQEALERKAKAISQAQLTRSGHVYVLSNIGSFGEDVYKIGMTRRLDPLDRVRELGSASVPFRFDVHALIYTEDAPTLESTLHRHFHAQRVNLANLRREYFRVSLSEIQEAVELHFGDATFVTVPEAEEYYRTLSIRENEMGCGSSPETVDELSLFRD